MKPVHMDSSRDFISGRWRAGFELEVVLGSLGEARLEEYEEDPMDMASPEYCRTVRIGRY